MKKTKEKDTTPTTSGPLRGFQPGPWHRVGLEIADIHNIFVASTECECKTKFEGKNATLIAAAPKMFEALIIIRDAYEAYLEDDTESGSLLDFMDRVDALHVVRAAIEEGFGS